YDQADRLVEAQTPEEDEAYSYDGLGNRLSSADYPLWDYNANNQLTGFDETSYSYDDHGNMTAKTVGGTTTTFTYTVDNRLQKMEKDTGEEIGSYVYDPFGRRLWKEVDGTRTYFHYNDEGLAGEYTADGSELKSYGYHPGSSWTTNPLFLRLGDEYYWYVNDHLGTPQQLVAENGSIVWEARYDAFGKAEVVVAAVENNLRFPGQYFDGESGLHYNWHRFYDPSTGRYISADPIGLAGGMNLYAYVGGDPVNAIDPEGLKTYMCTAPLHALGGEGTRSGPDVVGNLLYHQYLCVSEGKGAKVCGGQDQRGQKWYDPISGPGTPSVDSYDWDKCEEVEPEDKCIENCLLTKFGETRPRYGIPFGTDCQEWADKALEECREDCKNAKKQP
ncbi:RHS domain-containing protein, partial [Myxococcota bacterium]|nr:RHS domain-containing protein [Myxococcota bacterium]